MNMKHNAMETQFELYSDTQELMGIMQYTKVGENELEITHTKVFPAYEGHGYAADLLNALAEYARQCRAVLVPACSYVKRAFEKHPEKYEDVMKDAAVKRREIVIFDYAREILTAVSNGVLLTTKTENRVNAMTISWGTLGIEWGKPIFTAFIRENRFTRQQLEQNPEFTINIPNGAFDKKILGVCGTKSGHDTDKISDLNVTLVPAATISVPALRELPLTLECRVIYKQKQAEDAISAENKQQFYPQDVSSSFHGANKDFHIAYYGEIVNAYILE